MNNLIIHLPIGLRNLVDEIVAGIALCETAVFCGAGISRNSGLPTVNQIFPYIIDKLDISKEDIGLILDKSNYPKIPFESFIEILERTCNIDSILKIYDQGEPNTNHRFLANLIKLGKIKTLVTTNFDTLIEQALLLKPNSFEEGRDFDVIYKEQDFVDINWSDDRIRLIKLHGSIHDINNMAITIKQISSKTLLEKRKYIVDQIFSKGKHSNVLILGYSSSDIFDLSPQIESIKEKHKKVYYIEHSNKPTDSFKTEDIRKQKQKNPFKEFKFGERIYFDTNVLTRILWDSIPCIKEPYKFCTLQTNWKESIDNWFKKSIAEHTNIMKYYISGYIYIDIGEYKSAISNYNHALRLSKKICDKPKEAFCLGYLGNAYLKLGEYVKAKKYYEEALTISIQYDEKIMQGAWQGSLGSIYYHFGEYKKAIECFEQSLSLSKLINDKTGEITWLVNLGNTLSNIHSFNDAFSYLQQALIIARDIGEKQKEVGTLGCLGGLFCNIGEFNKSLEYYMQALPICEELSDKLNKTEILGGVGNCYSALKNYIKAIEFYEQALKVAINIGYKSKEGAWLGSLGYCNYHLGKIEEAENYFIQALTISMNVGDKHYENIWAHMLGNYYFDMRIYDKAKIYYEKALNAAQEIGDNYEAAILRGRILALLV